MRSEHRYSLRAWKIQEDGTKRLMDLVESSNPRYIKNCHKLFKELYCYWNYEVELKEVQ